MILADASDIMTFFGRFHILLIHLPIGFIILAFIMEMTSRFLSKYRDMGDFTGFILWCGCISSFMAVLLGYLLSLNGGYNQGTLLLHMWLGILVFMLSGITAFVKSNINGYNKTYLVLLSSTVICISITGHLGGNLTHGSNYLIEHAPLGIKGFFLTEEEVIPEITKIEEAYAFRDVIKPFLDSKCLVCHNQDKMKGNLDLSSVEAIKKGGKNGSILEKKNSEMIRRVTLPTNHKEFMPTDGKPPLTLKEITLLKWWIGDGASFEIKVSEISETTDEITSLIKEQIGIDKKERVNQKRLRISEKILKKIKRSGFTINPNASSKLDITFIPQKDNQITLNKLKVLLDVKDHIGWLKLSRTGVDDDALLLISQFTSLTKLWLDNTKITDQGIQNLRGLKSLQYLNLCGNNITNESIETLKSLDNLKSLYIWNTQITKAVIL